MKTLRLIGTGLFAVLLCCVFTSCSGDDEDDPNPPGQETPAPDGGGEAGEGGDSSEDDVTQGEGGVNAGHARAVDLGLPSGTLWADRNIGADSPEDYGYYFAWGETEPKDVYDWSTYKWCNGSYKTLTKYCTDKSYGTFDNRIILDASDDAATANWGDEWCMPAEDKFAELIDKCTWAWTTQDGVNGFRVTGPNGNYIFLPAAGRYGDGYGLVGCNASYWSNSLDEYDPGSAHHLTFDSTYKGLSSAGYRYYGFAVRAVANQGEGGVNSGHAIAVNLGLPSGILWADRNIGADSPEDYGDYFAWGETEPKDVYDWSTYKWCRGTMYTITKYCVEDYYGNVDNKIVLGVEDDAATYNWGYDWRMPTKDELLELKTECVWTGTTLNGIRGCKVTGPNGNYIFFPMAGYREDDSLKDVGALGAFWTNSLNDIYSSGAMCLYFNQYNSSYGNSHRDDGRSVRAVVK